MSGSLGRSGKVRAKMRVTLWGKGDGRDLIPLFETAIADLKQRQAHARASSARPLTLDPSAGRVHSCPAFFAPLR
jgi:hypothetical protein